ncbi:hypothetical protein KAR91_36590 [Candidatus Pacearchaeota archaeon]|nr:hypothetical protein [Candidatus Pacearchaeota archaeon]
MKKSDGEAQFAQFIRSDEWEYPEPEEEQRYFPLSKRKWRADFMFPDYRVAIEIQGGQFTRGGHARMGESAVEFERMNAIQIGGWIVLQVAPQDVGADWFYKQVGQALRIRGWEGEK